MYHIIAAKNRAHLACGQHGRQWQITCQSADLSAPTCRAIQGRQQQPDFSRPDGIAHLLKPGNSQTSPTRQTYPVTATLNQYRFDAICELRRYRYWSARGS
jgi:hypothetical protein